MRSRTNKSSSYASTAPRKAWIGKQTKPASPAAAAASGAGELDVAMLPSEVAPVLKVLRQNGRDVVAIHHHMLDTQPAVTFLHYWETGPADKLATGFKAALDQLGKAKSSR